MNYLGWTKEEAVEALKGHPIYRGLGEMIENGQINFGIVVHVILGEKNPPNTFDLLPKEKWEPHSSGETAK